MRYYLLDIERTVRTGQAHYWKYSCFGYTTNLEEAGLFEEEEAIDIYMNDAPGDTFLISEETVKRTLR